MLYTALAGCKQDVIAQNEKYTTCTVYTFTPVPSFVGFSILYSEINFLFSLLCSWRVFFSLMRTGVPLGRWPSFPVPFVHEQSANGTAMHRSFVRSGVFC